MLCSNYARELRKVPKVGQFAQMLQMMMCFGQEQPLATWMGLSSPSSHSPVWAWCVTFIFNIAETQRETISDWHPPESIASCISCSKDRKFSKHGISVETPILLPSCIPPLQSLSTSKVQNDRVLWQLFNCVKHSCMSERTLGLAFTRNLFRTIFSGIK